MTYDARTQRERRVKVKVMSELWEISYVNKFLVTFMGNQIFCQS